MKKIINTIGTFAGVLAFLLFSAFVLIVVLFSQLIFAIVN